MRLCFPRPHRGGDVRVTLSRGVTLGQTPSHVPLDQAHHREPERLGSDIVVPSWSSGRARLPSLVFILADVCCGLCSPALLDV